MEWKPGGSSERGARTGWMDGVQEMACRGLRGGDWTGSALTAYTTLDGTPTKCKVRIQRRVRGVGCLTLFLSLISNR